LPVNESGVPANNLRPARATQLAQPHQPQGETMSCKSKSFALAFGAMSVVLMPLGTASAATVVRDHREKPIVRDHRGDNASGGGVVVKSNGPRKPGKKKLWCIGIPCF
jgi:hypothetical protein